MPKFVIHKHLSKRPHYDLRLEMDGVLKSFALPKEPKQTPGERRLAIEVEDHPLSYLNFEGEIPEGQYGAGKVFIWDFGDYELESRKENKIVFHLKGKRLFGRFVLVRTKDRNWIFMKTVAERKKER